MKTYINVNTGERVQSFKITSLATYHHNNTRLLMGDDFSYTVTGEFFNEYNIQIGDYFIKYSNGSEVVNTASTFEEFHKPANTLTTEEYTKAHGGKIKGDKQLTYNQIALINRCKAAGDSLDELMDQIQIMIVEESGNSNGDDTSSFRRSAWAEDGYKSMQLGMMQLIRAIADPEGF